MSEAVEAAKIKRKKRFNNLRFQNKEETTGEKTLTERDKEQIIKTNLKEVKTNIWKWHFSLPTQWEDTTEEK